MPNTNLSCGKLFGMNGRISLQLRVYPDESLLVVSSKLLMKMQSFSSTHSAFSQAQREFQGIGGIRKMQPRGCANIT
jgi:hypothetical protein